MVEVANAQTDAPTFYIGQVSSQASNHCRVTLPADSGYDNGVYVHISVGAELVIGDTVAFQIHLNARGLPAASAPAWKLVGHVGNQPPQLGECSGQVKSVEPDGSALLDCPDLLADSQGADVYVHSSVVQKCSLEVGQIIAFNLQMSASGQAQAAYPCWKCCSPDWRVARQLGVNQMHDTGQRAWQMAAPAEQAPFEMAAEAQEAAQGEPGQEELEYYHIGSVTSLGNNHSRVTCPDSGYDSGVYAHFSVAAGVVVGDTVAFQIHVNAKGQPAASAPTWKMVGKSFGGKPVTLGEQVGQITRMVSDGSVFLDCPALAQQYGTEVYCHSSVVEQCGLQVGETIAFTVHVNKRGQPQVSAPCWKCISPHWRLDKAIAGEYQSTAPSEFSQEVPDAREEEVEEVFRESGQAWGQTWGQPGQPMEPAEVREEEVEEIFRQLTGGEVQAPVPGQAISMEPAMSPDHLVGSVSWVSANHSRVACPDAGQENGVYVHAKVGSDLTVGDTVAFKIHVNAKGQSAASAPMWKLMGKVFAGNEVELGGHLGRVLRTVKDGSAFLECPQLETEVYAHASVVQQCQLWIGDTVAFSVHYNKKGLPQVSAPCWKCCTANWKFSQLSDPGKGDKGGQDGGFQKGKGATWWDQSQWGGASWKGKGGQEWESPQPAKKPRVIAPEEKNKGKGGNSWAPSLGPALE